MFEEDCPDTVGFNLRIAEALHYISGLRWICTAILLTCEKAPQAGLSPAAHTPTGIGKSLEKHTAKVFSGVFLVFGWLPGRGSDEIVGQPQHR
jgi:hypothetical protein